ncbi:hypothetical protein SEA_STORMBREAKER8_42 [Microbacterium phage Stormbreaker8]|nr:hypothetical protein SEA_STORMBREAKER8_42 [Microbacterium phage Stormbreaker8]
MATMDIDKEFAAVDFKIKMLIRKRALEAEARIYGMEPREYAAKLDREAREKAIATAVEQSRAVGRAYGEMARSLSDAITHIAEGFREAFGR